MQINDVVEIPLFNPAILERQGNFISRDQLPSKWVLDGASACLIAEDLKAGDEKTFLEDNKKFFLHRNASPLQLRDGTNGLNEVYKPPNRCFHAEPVSIKRNMPDKFDLHAGAQRVSQVYAHVLDQARQRVKIQATTTSCVSRARHLRFVGPSGFGDAVKQTVQVETQTPRRWPRSFSLFHATRKQAK